MSMWDSILWKNILMWWFLWRDTCILLLHIKLDKLNMQWILVWIVEVNYEDQIISSIHGMNSETFVYNAGVPMVPQTFPTEVIPNTVYVQCTP